MIHVDAGPRPRTPLEEEIEDSVILAPETGTTSDSQPRQKVRSIRKKQIPQWPVESQGY